MSNRESWKTWIAVAGLLLFAGLASAVMPFILDQVGGDDGTPAETTEGAWETTIDVSQLPFVGEVLVEIPLVADNIQGQPITALQAFGVAIGAVLVGVGAIGLLITVITILFDRLVNRVYADDDYKEAKTELDKREKARIKELQESKPPTIGAEQERRWRWSMGVFGFIFLLFVWIVGLTLGTVYFEDAEVNILGLTMSAVAFFNLILTLVTVLFLFLALRNREPEDLENPESDNNPVNWGFIWIIVSGLLIVGIGAGAALATRGG